MNMLGWPTIDPDEAVRVFLRLYDEEHPATGCFKRAWAYAQQFGVTVLDQHRYLIGRDSGARHLRVHVQAGLDRFSRLDTDTIIAAAGVEARRTP